MQKIQEATADILAQVAQAHADGSALWISGGGSKGFYVGAHPGLVVSTAGLRGIISYEPSELVVTVAAGTPLRELEMVLAERGQVLPFEPPRFGLPAAATVGGMIATGLAGPARASVGGVRDYVLGLRLINGLAQHLTLGGQVMKNVAGYDVSRLMVGALGTLGVLTEVSLKVLPVAPAEATLQFAMEQAPALEQMHRWGGQPLPLNASLWSGGGQDAARLLVRLRGATAAVEAACRTMLADVPGERLAQQDASAVWLGCRDQTLPFFRLPRAPWQLWRVSLPPVAPVLSWPGDTLVEWHGGLRWVWVEPGAEASLRQAAVRLGGTAACWRHGPGVGSRLAVTDPAQRALASRLKASFDPRGILNPALMHDAN